MPILVNHVDEAHRRREEAFLSRVRAKEQDTKQSAEPLPQTKTVDDPKFSSVNDRQKNSLITLLGETIVRALKDPLTLDVMLNDDGAIYQDRLGESAKEIGYMGFKEAMGLVSYVAGCFNMVVNAREPILTCELPLWNGPRFECQVPPIVPSPTFTIRKKAVLIYSLNDYVSQGVITKTQRKALARAVQAKKNILVIGGTKSGKTTFVNGIIDEMTIASPDDRQIIIEDTREIQSVCKNKVNFCTSLEISMTDLLKTTLRMSPDRIIVGEVRGPEAHDLIQAWNTGHPGGTCTIHADDCESGLDRLADLIQSHPYAPVNPHRNISRAVHVLVNIQKDPDCRPAGRRVQEIKEIENWSFDGGYVLKDIL